MTTFEVISLIINAIGAFFIGISILLLAKQLKLIILAHADNHEWNRRIETQHALAKVRELNTDDLNEKFGYIELRKPIPLKDIETAFKEDPSLQLSLHKLLDHYEGLADGILFKIYDEEAIRISRKGSMERDLLQFREYIQSRRDVDDKTAWINSGKLVKKWSEETVNRKQTGEI